VWEYALAADHLHEAAPDPRRRRQVGDVDTTMVDTPALERQ